MLFILLATLIVAGAYLRFYELSAAPYWMDEGYTINAVLSISETGRSVLDSGMPYRCPLYCYPTAWLADTFGHGALTYRLIAAVFGVLLIPLIFLVGRRLFTPAVGLLSAFFITFEYFQVAWARQARWYTLFAFFFWLALFAFHRAYYSPEHRLRYGLLSALATLLALLTHGLGYLLPFLMLGWVAVDKVLLERRCTVRQAGLLALATLALALTLEYALGMRRLSTLLSDLAYHNVAPFYLQYYLGAYGALLPLALAGILLTYRTHKRSVYFLLYIATLYLLPLMFLTNVVHYRYAWHLTPALLLLSALGTHALMSYRPHPAYRAGVLTLAGALFFLFGTGTLTPERYYFLEADDPTYPQTFPGTEGYYAYTPQPDWNSAYAFIATERTEGDIVISSHPHFNKIFLQEPGYWLAYRYHGASTLPSSIRDGREYYVGAQVVASVSALRALTSEHSGFIIFDYMASDGRIPEDTLQYIRRELPLAYHERTNTYSQVWVYSFGTTSAP